MLSLNFSEISTYKRIHFKLKSVNNVLGILLKSIIKIRKSRFYENFHSKNCRMLPVFDKKNWVFLGEREYFKILSKNIKCGNLNEKYGDLP